MGDSSISKFSIENGVVAAVTGLSKVAARCATEVRDAIHFGLYKEKNE